MSVSRPVGFCVGCGQCCRTVQCDVSVECFGTCEVCPELHFRHNRYWCGLARDFGARLTLGIGTGCTSGLYSHHQPIKAFEGTREEFEQKYPVQPRDLSSYYW